MGVAVPALVMRLADYRHTYDVGREPILVSFHKMVIVLLKTDVAIHGFEPILNSRHDVATEYFQIDIVCVV